METSPVAWYAAILSTTVLAWDFAKWWRAEPRLRISAKADVSYPDGEVVDREQRPDGSEVSTLASYCHVDIVNTGGRPTTLIGVEAIAKRAGRGEMGYDVTAFTRHRGSDELPTKLAPGDLWSARIDMRKLEGMAEFGHLSIRVKAAFRDKPVEARVSRQRKG